MIETLSIQNFKVLRSVEVPFRPLTLIVGPNASGKSSLLQALSFVFRRQMVSAPTLPPRQEVLTKGASGPAMIQCSGRERESGSFSIKWNGESGDLDRQPPQAPRGLRVANLRLEPVKLATPTPLKDVTLTLPSSGEGLAAILAGLSLEYPERFQEVVERLRKVVPTVLNLRVTRRQLSKEQVGFEVLFDMEGVGEVHAAGASDGTLLTLGLLTVLSTPDPPGLVLIDDLERGLHPRALGELIQLLRKIQQQDPELQIVATSHSPYLLDHLRAEEILLTALDDEGYAVVRSLAEHPEYERWKDVMAPGEFWSTVGESWVTASAK
jgi:predicted ATPase